LHRAGWYYRHRKRDDAALRMRLRELAAARPRFGYNRLHILLRREGQVVNLKRVRESIVKKAESALTYTPPQACIAAARCAQSADSSPRALEHGFHEWIRCSKARTDRVLTVVDILSRFSPIIEADHTMNGTKVVAAL